VGTKVIAGISGKSWRALGVSIITTVVCNCGRSGYKQRKKRLDEWNSICRWLGFMAETIENL